MSKNKRQLIKKFKRHHHVTKQLSYIEKLKHYYQLFNDFPSAKNLINNVLESNQLLSQGQLPQDLPQLLLPDDIQQQVATGINAKYPQGNPRGDQIWDQLNTALPQLDKLLRSYRDFIEQQYGMWAYISAPFTRDLAQFIGHRKALEVMCGNGYISKGLRDNGVDVIATDSLAWTHEAGNQTGHHLVTKVEKYDAVAAFNQYKEQVEVVIMSWSPDGLDIDWRLLQAIRQSKRPIQFLVIGEKNGATDSKIFWQNAHLISNDEITRLNRHHQPFDLIHDQLYLVR